MKNERMARRVPPELSEEYDEYVDDAVALARNELSRERERQVRDRMEHDAMYRAVVEPILDAYKAPPLPPAERERLYADFRRRVGLSTPQADADLLAFQQRARSRGSRWKRVTLRIAAVFAFIIAGALSVPVYVEYAWFQRDSTPANASATITLPDQSVVRLGPSSRLRYLKGMRGGRGTLRRDVYLTGVGAFEVTHLAGGKRFEVYTSTAHVIAIGTRFTVVEHEGSTDVTVDEGRVTVQAVDDDGNDTGRAESLAAGASARVIAGAVIVGITPTSQGAPQK